jgi:hypothetical protein
MRIVSGTTDKRRGIGGRPQILTLVSEPDTRVAAGTLIPSSTLPSHHCRVVLQSGRLGWITPKIAAGIAARLGWLFSFYRHPLRLATHVVMLVDQPRSGAPCYSEIDYPMSSSVRRGFKVSGLGARKGQSRQLCIIAADSRFRWCSAKIREEDKYNRESLSSSYSTSIVAAIVDEEDDRIKGNDFKN